MAAGNTVLIVDDDPQYRQLIGEILQHSGWSVLTARDGEEAVRLARDHKPDAVLCDLLMPGENGFAVCRNLRAEPRLQNTRIIVTSGRDYGSDRQAAFAAGADDYLTKPIKGTDLLKVLSGQSRQSEPTPTRSVAETPARQGSDVSGPGWLKFWGVRGSIPTPGPTTVRYGGNTSCIEV
ncbi:MAG TPA: response regulator, partial [Candidatus Dormibacteraeota bacterium]|nr:response regulator [Candidatus Dormibacteraeota bacterium]